MRVWSKTNSKIRIQCRNQKNATECGERTRHTVGRDGGGGERLTQGTVRGSVRARQVRRQVEVRKGVRTETQRHKTATDGSDTKWRLTETTQNGGLDSPIPILQFYRFAMCSCN